MNIINNQKYKVAIIEYICSECLLGGNITIEFSKVSQVKPGNCGHFNINFLFISEMNSMKLSISFKCKLCDTNNIIELFNQRIVDNNGSISYKCPECGGGNLTIGYLLSQEKIDLDDIGNFKIPKIIDNDNKNNKNNNINNNINNIKYL